MVFVSERLHVHTTLVQSAAQIRTILLHSKIEAERFQNLFTKYEQHETEQGSRKFCLS